MVFFAVADCFEKLSLDIVFKDVREIIFFVENSGGVVVDKTFLIEEFDQEVLVRKVFLESIDLHLF